MEYLYSNGRVAAKGSLESGTNCPAPAKRWLERGTQVRRNFSHVGSSFSRAAVSTGIAFLLLSTVSFAQVLKRPHEEAPPSDANQSKINVKSKKHWPRAIGVVEFLPGGGVRLVPVALWIDDRFYDASLYAANPAPMAVQPETVYEAMAYGEPTGLFTVITPREVKGSWVAVGKWKPQLAMDEMLAKEAAKKPKPELSSSITVKDDRPTLHRKGSKDSSGSDDSGSSAQSTDSTTTPPSSEDDPDRPVLKRPEEASKTDSSSTPANASASSTPAAQAAGGGLDNAPSPDENDPNRPVLRRGTPGKQAAAAEPTFTPAAGQTAAMDEAEAKLSATLTSAGQHSYPAISYAGPYEPRSLLYALNAQERESKGEQMRAMALDEIRSFIAKRHTPALPKNVLITNFDLRAFDLQYTNSPTLVFTATLPVAGAKAFRGGEFDYFVTVVAHLDINDTPIKIFSSVTDSNHLDAFPRMEIIDAVDADANGRGDLLFRQYSDTGINYSLFRVFPYEMQKVFEGGSGV